MALKELSNVKMGMTWTSYLASVYGVLNNAGLWQEPLWKMMGHTGIAFHFIMHEDACPSSATVYDWQNEHFYMMDRIGVYSDIVCLENHTALNTKDYIHQDAIAGIKKSIDKGIGVVVWTPTPLLEFGIIKGYDDDDRVFTVNACSEESADPLLYDNLGISNVPMLYYQIFHERVHVPEEKIVREVLEYGLSQWKKESHVSPQYASGRKAYENLVSTLGKKSFNPFGLSYCLAVYNDAKENLARYLEFLNEETTMKGSINAAVKCIRQVSANFKRMAELVPFSINDAKLSDKDIPEMITLAKESLALEETLYENILKALEG